LSNLAFNSDLNHRDQKKVKMDSDEQKKKRAGT